MRLAEALCVALEILKRTQGELPRKAAEIPPPEHSGLGAPIELLASETPLESGDPYTLLESAVGTEEWLWAHPFYRFWAESSESLDAILPPQSRDLWTEDLVGYLERWSKTVKNELQTLEHAPVFERWKLRARAEMSRAAGTQALRAAR